jgi:hypothetical protein
MAVAVTDICCEREYNPRMKRAFVAVFLGLTVVSGTAQERPDEGL